MPRAERERTSPGRLPLRKSLLGRLLAVSALVAACSVAATAWLAVQTTSGAIKQEQGQNLADDARIYNTLMEPSPMTHRPTLRTVAVAALVAGAAFLPSAPAFAADRTPAPSAEGTTPVPAPTRGDDAPRPSQDRGPSAAPRGGVAAGDKPAPAPAERRDAAPAPAAPRGGVDAGERPAAGATTGTALAGSAAGIALLAGAGTLVLRRRKGAQGV